jgi:hypothetical protein
VSGYEPLAHTYSICCIYPWTLEQFPVVMVHINVSGVTIVLVGFELYVDRYSLLAVVAVKVAQ